MFAKLYKRPDLTEMLVWSFFGDTILENRDELIKFYQIWCEYFNDVSNKWKELLFREVDMIYERKCKTVNNFIKHQDILNSIWSEIRINKIAKN